jgi:lambda family phage portal protein
MSQDGGRLLSSFFAPSLSANQEVELALRTLRNRARALVQNNGYAEGVVSECVSNIIGPVGIQLRAQTRTLGADRPLHTPTNDAIEAAWARWNVPEYASADGHDAWTDIEGLIVRTLVIDGELFYREVRGEADNPFGYSIELVDADLVDETYNRRAAAGQNEIRMGVELGARGRPVAYHVWSRHPGEGPRERLRIPATEMHHVFRRLRPGQVRGVTWFAPVLATHAMLAFYEEAEVTAARWAAAKLGIWEAGPDADVDESAPKEVPLDAPPGSILEGPVGYKFNTFDPQHPNAAFKDFVDTLLRGIARGLGVSYLTLTGDVAAANYSSMRAGLLPEREMWRALQQWIIRTVHRRVYRGWLEMALLSGALRLDSRLASTYDDVVWMPRGWKWVDPLKDAQAAQILIGLGLESRTRLTSEQGDDFEQIIDERAAEEAYADAEDVDISGTLGTPAALAQEAPPNGSAPSGASDRPSDSTDASASPRLAVL